MANTLPLTKRIFDLTVVLLAAPLWIPAMLLTALAILLTSGWPVIYSSKRYVLKGSYRTVIKFRAMVKNAEQLANRENITPEPGKLLNITIRDDLYTSLGKTLEKIHFTELPQLVQVLAGTLTLVGNRPMPENMLRLGRQVYPYLEERFAIPSGITGPAQLAGRDRLSDKERLDLEITYTHICRIAYSPLLDLHLLLITLCTPLGMYRQLAYDEVFGILFAYLDKNQRDVITSAVKKITGATTQQASVKSSPL